jgi:hypothetical protein
MRDTSSNNSDRDESVVGSSSAGAPICTRPEPSAFAGGRSGIRDRPALGGICQWCIANCRRHRLACGDVVYPLAGRRGGPIR